MSPALLASLGIFCVATNAALQLRNGFLAGIYRAADTRDVRE
jgi:hypothetical protein